MKILAASGLALASLLPCQTAREPLFRNPDVDVAPPSELYAELRRMHGIARAKTGRAADAPRTYDAEGREVVDDAAWREIRERLPTKIHRQAGYLGQILEKSGSVEDRAIAAFGAFYVDEVQQTMQLIELLPGEPSREIRTESFQRAVEFLRVHLPKNRTEKGNQGRPVEVPAYEFAFGSFLRLLEAEDGIDRAQAAWVLTHTIPLRADLPARLIGVAERPLRMLVVDEDAGARTQGRALLAAIAPKGIKLPADDAPREAWSDAVTAVRRVLLPPVRRFSEGRVDLYVGTELTPLLKEGRALLARDAIGVTMTGRSRDGVPFRGYRIARLPEPFDRLGLPMDAVVTSIQGQPVAEAAQIVAVLDALAPKVTSVLVEYIDDGQPRALEVRIFR
jgi:hypothetical protein